MSKDKKYKKAKTIQIAKSSGKDSPSIINENGNIIINYDNHSKDGDSKPNKNILLKGLFDVSFFVSFFASCTGILGYSIKDLIKDDNDIPNVRVETKGDNSPAVIVIDGNSTINYDTSNQEKDSTSKK